MVAHHDVAPWIERFARVGYVAKAVLYGTVGILAAKAAVGQGEATDSRGAMMKVLDAPFGRALLLIIAAGLFGYAVWRCVSAIVDAEGRGNGPKGLALRVSFLARGLIHLGLAYSAAKLATGDRSAGQADNSERAAGAALSLPYGSLVLWAGAVTLVGFGLYQVYRALAAKLSKQLNRGELESDTGDWVVVVCRVGIAARGLVFMAIGWLVGRAAATRDADKAGGIAEALETVQAIGRWPYAAIGAGLMAYGFYELVNARYRRVEAN